MPPSPSSRVLVAALAALAACTPRPGFAPGDDCELNTECSSPLVCRLGHCRIECRAQRDCGPGLECVRDALGLGACQLPSEAECSLTSDCPEPLVCHFGRCTNECGDDRDCPPGARCTTDESGNRGCRDEATTQCQLHSECERIMGQGYICAVDGRCRVPCITDWDCSDGRRCLRRESGMPYCGYPEEGGMDGGAPPPDASAPDAGTDGGPDAAIVTPPDPPRMAAGQYTTCAAPAGADLHCWGDNADGQIGDGTTMRRLVPTAVFGGSEAGLAGVGQGHACAVLGGSLHCWGRNDFGQLGLGTVSSDDELSPRPVTGLPAGIVEDLSLGAQHTCAIVSGALYCWGRNNAGQLGIGDTAPQSESPTLVSGLRGRPVEVATFSQHTCVRLDDGRVDCFGSNGWGQLGNGGTAPSPSPTPVASITDAVDLATGGSHTCALRATGTVECWGSGALGQLGNGGTDPSPTPTPTVPIPEPVLQIDAGSAHTCARTASAVYCWGANGDGQCGRNRSTEPVVHSPAPVAGLTAVAEVRAGSNHTCVHVSGTSLSCFGQNTRGQLGDGTMTTSSSPVTVAWP